MKKDLFFCFTPLQILIAKSIILSGEYEGGQPECYVFPLSSSKRYEYYYQLIEPLCSRSELVTSLPSFPFYLGWLKRRFSGAGYRNIYLASIDSVFVQFFLSKVAFERVRTFDDGTANILKSSKYYTDESGIKLRLKRFVWGVFGNRYSKERIVKESSLHYTLYPGFGNLIDNLKPVSLSYSESGIYTEPKKKRILVFVGTVLKDVLKVPGDHSLLLERTRTYYLEQSQCEAVYLPHPRDEFDYFPEIPKRESSLIAEEVIVELLNEYEEVLLVGFGSSTQFNLMAQSGIKNVVIDSHLLQPRMRELVEMLARAGAERVLLD